MARKHSRSGGFTRIHKIIAAAWPILGAGAIVGPLMQSTARAQQQPPVEPDCYFFWNGNGTPENPGSGDVSDPNSWNYGPNGPPGLNPPTVPDGGSDAIISTNSDTAPITVSGDLDVVAAGFSGAVDMAGSVSAGADGIGSGADPDFPTTLGPVFSSTVSSSGGVVCDNSTFESTVTVSSGTYMQCLGGNEFDSSVTVSGVTWFDSSNESEDDTFGSFTAGGGALVDGGLGVYGGSMTVDTNSPGETLPDSSLAFYSDTTALQVGGNLFVSGATLTCAGDAVFGSNSTGALVVVSNGGTLTTQGQTLIGVNDPYNDSDNGMAGNAYVAISGPGSSWEAQDDVYVGDADFAGGAIDISGGAFFQLDAGVTVSLGSAQYGNGALTFDGTGGTPYLFGPAGTSIVVGDQGFGYLQIQNGAQIIYGGSVVVGNEETSTGTVDIDGDGSSLLSVGSFDVGYSGTGSVAIYDGAEATILNLSVGTNDTGDGEIDVGTPETASSFATVGSLTVLGTLTVGDAGSGTLTAAVGSTVSVEGKTFTIGGQPGGNGVVILDGATLSFDGSLVIGDGGTGLLQMDYGASNVVGTLAGPTVTLGAQTGSAGGLTLDGTGTMLQVNGITVGDLGDGYVSLSDNAELISSGDMTVAEGTGDIGSIVEVSGSSVLIVGGDLTVGSGGAATMEIDSGGQVAAAGSVSIGDQSGGDGSVTVDGDSSSLQFGDTLIVGNSGTGELNVTGGASVSPAADATGEVDVAGQTGSTGTLMVSGGGSILTANSLAVGGTMEAAGGDGAVTVSDSGKLDVSGLVKVWADGEIDLDVQGTTFDQLSIAEGGVVDDNGDLVIDYGTAASDPAASIFSYLHSGYAGGAWNGTGINSSSVANLDASQKKLIYALGYADSADGIVGGLASGQIEIIPTLAGDAKLQGDVVFGDFQILAQYFGKSGGWDEGNFTYGATVDFGDFQELAQDFGANDSALTAGGSSLLTAGGSSLLTAGEIASLDSFAAQFGDTLVANPDGVGFQVVAVPEPASMCGIACGFLLLRRRRARR
ncbi:MAG TPA: hypothetical protein VL992_21590 [Tepidisphaeraceae bacterium]|nr:hypothetical protein [Tepidisphaeraceae bacterium]